MSKMYKLDLKDVAKGLVTAVFMAVFMAIYAVVVSGDFDVFTANWTQIWHVIVNTSIITFISYIAKNFFSDKEGKFLGKIG